MKKDIETIKKDQSEIKNAISEINNTLERINNSLDEAEDQIRNLEDKRENNTQSEQQKAKRLFFKNEDSLRDIWDNMKHTTPTLQGYQKEKKESKRSRTYLKK